MKIFHLITNTELGGAQNVVIDLAHCAAGSGHEVAVASMPDGPLWQLLDPHIRRFFLPHMVKPVSPRHDLRCLPELRSAVRTFSPDIIHLHSSKAGALGRMAAPGRRRRIVYTIHGFDTIRKAHRAFLPVEQVLQYFCGAIVPVSEYDRTNLAAEHIHRRVTVIPNAVKDRLIPDPFSGAAFADTEQRNAAFRAIKKAKDSSQKTVLTVARLAPPKRFDLFIETAARSPMKDTAFFWIGNPQDRPLPELPPNVVMLGEIPGAGDFINLCDVFFLLSDYEGMPVTILEALSCGKPVVASDAGGIPETLGFGGGFLTENTAEAAEKTLSRLLSDGELRAQTGREARTAYEAKYRISAMWEAYESLYRKLFA